MEATNYSKEDFERSFISECTVRFGKETADEIQFILSRNLEGYQMAKEIKALTTMSENPNQWYIEQFLAIKIIKGLSEKSIALYNASLRVFFRIITKDARDIITNDIRLFIAKKAGEGVSKVTINNYIACLRSFFSTLCDEGCIPKNPTARIDKLKTDSIVKKPFTGEEIEKLRKEFSAQPREKAILELLLSTGCRIGEIVGINRKDIKDNKIIVTGKGKKQRTVFLNAPAQFAIAEYLSTRTDNDDALFVGRAQNSDAKIKRLEKGRIEQIFRESGRRIGIEKCHPHRFRHTMATSALRHGMPIDQVSKMLGHSQLTTTQIYAKSEESDIENAHLKYVR